MSEINPPSHESGNPEVSYETRDVNIRGIFGFGIGMAVAGVFIHFLLVWLFHVLKEGEDKAQARLPAPIEKLRKVQSEDMIPPLKKGDQADARPQTAIDTNNPRRRISRLDRDSEWQPRLQTDPTRDMEAMRQAEQEYLQGYGWVDRRAGIARMPIDRAMRLLTDPRVAKAMGIRVRPPKKGKQPTKQRDKR